MPQLKLPTMSQPSFDLVFGYVYTGLAVNLCMAAANAPLAVAVLFAADPLSAWPFLLLLSLTLAPSVAAAFAAFAASNAANAGGTSPFSAFWRGWLRAARPALMIGTALGALVLLVGLDLSATSGTAAGAFLAPVLLIIVALAIASTALVLAGLGDGAGEARGAGLGALVTASVYLALRRAPLSLLSLAALAGACVFVLAQPVLGTLLGVAPLLFIVFSNARVSLAPATVTDAAEG